MNKNNYLRDEKEYARFNPWRGWWANGGQFWAGASTPRREVRGRKQGGILKGKFWGWKRGENHTQKKPVKCEVTLDLDRLLLHKT